MRNLFFFPLLALQICAASDNSSELLRRDWLRQAELRFTMPEHKAALPCSCEDDAAGAVNNNFTQEWGFHTDRENNPWWQVDLQQECALDHIVIHNRQNPSCDSRNAAIQVLLSAEGHEWTKFYQHNGSTFGFGKNALTVKCDGQKTRFIRLMVLTTDYFHLSQVEVYAQDNPANIALHQPATQSSVSTWSMKHSANAAGNWDAIIKESISRGRKLAAELDNSRINHVQFDQVALAAEGALQGTESLNEKQHKELYFSVRAAVRALALQNPLLNFDKLLVTKLLDPGWIYHMSDQYLGWWSRPGGGIYVLENFKSETPREICLTGSFAEGCFQRPMLSWDGGKVLFAYCKFYQGVAENRNKLDKAALPEDSFYHLYEMNIDGSGLKQLTFGKYNDFDGRYLPDGNILFLSTRRGPNTRYSNNDVRETLKNPALDECYVRCGGDAYRPVAVYTLHTIAPDGSDMRTISPFEMFEWTPSVAGDGSIIYARWDYIDRNNQPFMSLWRMNPDGTQPEHLFGNYTENPNTMFEARQIPGSRKYVFTAGAHHANTGGSLVMLDVTRGEDGEDPMTRLTPEVPFTEYESNGNGSEWYPHYYASPWPLSETFYLTAWSHRGLRKHFQGNDDGARMGVYLYDAFGNLDLLCEDEAYQVQHPIPVAPRKKPPVIASRINLDASKKGVFILSDVYNSRKPMSRATPVTRLRIVAVPPKTQPTMNSPRIGLIDDDPGKCVLGTVPVESDGSAHFEAPSNVTLFFQALAEDGVVVQTMRSAASLQPGQSWSCAGCHESKSQKPLMDTKQQQPLAALRAPSKITPEASGSWPFRFDTLVQPVLQSTCIRCHTGEEGKPFALPSEPFKAWEMLAQAGKKPLLALAKAQYSTGASTPGQALASQSSLLPHLRELKTAAKITTDEFNRLVLWMDIYGQYAGHFSEKQEQELIALRKEWSEIGVLAP